MADIRYASFRSWATAVLLVMLAGPVLASQRVALVIGNAVYAHAQALANPLNDAADIGAALGRLGFSVTRIENAGQVQLRRGLQEFALAASASEVAVVFYAGHGIEVDRRNFLVPVDVRLASDQDVEFEAVPLELVSRAVERASGLRLVILDACRENPFAVNMQRAGATRSIGRGLARVEPSGETLVAYAAKEGTVASDGSGRNSPYSAALLRHLEEPGLEVGLMFRKVRDAVLASTGGRQEPFVYGSLSSRGVYLAAVPATGAPAAGTSAVGSETASERIKAEQLAAKRLAAERELLFWESIKDSDEPADFRAYLGRYQGGEYEALARNRLKRLEGSARAEAAELVVASAPEAGTKEAVSAPAPSSAEASPEMVESLLALDRSERRRIQRGLASLGFGPGPADGLFGNRTRSAVRSYQKEEGFPETGYLDAESAKSLLAATSPSDTSASTTTGGSISVQTSGGDVARVGPSQAPDPSRTFLASGMSLSDWVLLAEDRLVSGDYRSLLVEGAGHLRKFGTIDTVASVVERAIDGLIEDIRVMDEASARSALESVRRIKDVSGERVALHRIEAKAHSRLSQFEQAAAAYQSWLRAAPADHPERKKMAVGLQRVLRGEMPPDAVDPFRDCAECPQMIVLPPGRFRMGSTFDEVWRYFDEDPIHDVAIAEPIAVGVHEVTFSEWDACHRAGGCSYNPADSGWGRENRPVVGVSWKDTQDYVGWLSTKTGKHYRLLSESEWEYAARGGTTTRYHWGDDPGQNRANCKHCGDRSDASKTLPVGSFPSNPFGLFDVHGNVWEWVEDCWHRNYANAPSDGSAWVTQGSCGHRILRGGSWSVGPRNVRSAVRSRFAAGIRSDSIGFRVARTFESASGP